MKLPRSAMKKARIEIIPMIDAIFFLLVFFMMTSMAMIPMSGHKVDLPKSQTAALKPIEKVVVSISREGDYYIDRDKVAGVRAIKSGIAARLAHDPTLIVVINCDRTQNITRFAQAFDLIKQANAQNVMVATEPQTPGGGASSR
jgi:biopolymer transport protein ExbD